MTEKDKKDLTLAKIELGSDNTAIIEANFKDKNDEYNSITFKFKVHIPSMKENLKIAVKEEEILGEKTKDEYLNLSALMLATLEIVVDEIYFIDEKNILKKINTTFLGLTEMIKDINGFYKDILIPVYNKFIEFDNSIKIDFEDLKKKLTQI